MQNGKMDSPTAPKEYYQSFKENLPSVIYQLVLSLKTV